MTKRKTVAVALLMAGIVAVSVLVTAFTGVSHTREHNRLRVVASFYPVYIAALNVTDGVEGITVESLAEPSAGCLHNYQLSPDDRIALEGADLLLLNGGGAEEFLEDTLSSLPALPVVDTAEGLSLLPAGEHHHEEGEHDHECFYNEHIWTSPALYAAQVNAICEAMCALDPDNAAHYRQNTAAYQEQIKVIADRVAALKGKVGSTDAILFHNSLAYLAAELGLPVIATLPIGEDTAISAAELSAAEAAIDPNRRLWLLYDDQYEMAYTGLGEKATHSARLSLDTAVTGRVDKAAWVTAMDKNLTALEQALGGEA